LTEGISSELISPQQRLFFAQRKLHEILSEKSSTMSILIYIIENLLWVLWRHLDYYFNRYVFAQYREFSSEPQFFVTNTSELEEFRREISTALNQIQSGQTESTLGLLSRIDKAKYLNKPNIIYYVVRQLKELLRR